MDRYVYVPIEHKIPTQPENIDIEEGKSRENTIWFLLNARKIA